MNFIGVSCQAVPSSTCGSLQWSAFALKQLQWHYYTVSRSRLPFSVTWTQQPLSTSSLKVNDSSAVGPGLSAPTAVMMVFRQVNQSPLWSLWFVFPFGSLKAVYAIEKHQLQGLRLNLGPNAFESKFLRKYQVLSGIKTQQISKELISVLSLTLARREDAASWDMLLRKPEGPFHCPGTGLQTVLWMLQLRDWASFTCIIPEWMTPMPQVVTGEIRHLCLATKLNPACRPKIIEPQNHYSWKRPLRSSSLTTKPSPPCH